MWLSQTDTQLNMNVLSRKEQRQANTNKQADEDKYFGRCKASNGMMLTDLYRIIML